MNSRRKINNVTAKEGFEGMYNLHYSLNGDIRRNNNCAYHTESFVLVDGQPTFENHETLAKVAKQLSTSQKQLKIEILNLLP